MTLERTMPPTPQRAAAAMLIRVGTGCAATIGQDGLAQRTSVAIGRELGSFTIADQRPDTGGCIDYSVKTNDGLQYQCYLYSATGFQRVMSFGNTPHSDAICTRMVKGAGSAAPAKGEPSACHAASVACL
ncbi:MAG: hypothetical protein JWP47_2319 [Polaromonas sp.]|nr:hypothetical protein [Polaromonas sp.]